MIKGHVQSTLVLFVTPEDLRHLATWAEELWDKAVVGDELIIWEDDHIKVVINQDLMERRGYVRRKMP